MFPFKDENFQKECANHVKHLLEQNKQATETVCLAKGHLTAQSGAFIQSLDDFLTKYDKISQLNSINKYPLTFQHVNNLTNFIEEMHKRDYQLTYSTSINTPGLA